MKDAIRTDLASELELDGEGIRKHEQIHGHFTSSEIEIVTDSASERLGKPKGKYITLDIGKIWLASDEDFASAEALIAEQLEILACEMCGHTPGCVLIAGLGNRRITADALGDETVGLLTVTRHLKSDRQLWELLGGREICAVVPGVLGTTGIETVELVRGACESVKPELVIAIDSLCARSTDRLATTVQLGSSGISPGSGIGNRRLALDKATLGAPVIALGIPTVVESSTLVCDALTEAGIDELPEGLERVLESGVSFLVTPKESDLILRETSRLLAGAITRALS